MDREASEGEGGVIQQLFYLAGGVSLTFDHCPTDGRVVCCEARRDAATGEITILDLYELPKGNDGGESEYRE